MEKTHIAEMIKNQKKENALYKGRIKEVERALLGKKPVSISSHVKNLFWGKSKPSPVLPNVLVEIIKDYVPRPSGVVKK